ncbi:MAG: hypothetical protein ABSG05_00455 [Candidatus Pacearchaeota archaeon]|jgi:hypothetical protein
MVATIGQIIGKINPGKYAKNAKELLKEYGSPADIPADKVEEQPLSQHGLVYDSSSETLEPIYFFILDMMNDFRLQTEKLEDNFASSPGSGHFSEMGQRATIMQQQGTKILGDVNTVMRSMLNLVYDLKEFRIRLSQYDDLKTKNREAAILALKQVWMDKVDITKGNSSIKAMALGQAGFQTLIDAFLFAKDVKDIDKIDLNDRVKRILRPRILEFNDWLNNSEKELRKRYELEKSYLQSQVNSLKLYARWAKPYLKAAAQLEMKDMDKEPALVKTFNTIMLQLTLFGKQQIKADEEAVAGNLPKEFEKKKLKREFYACTLVEFKFRGIPQRIAQQSHYAFGGRADVTFKSYVLNSDELAKFKEEVENSDVDDVMKLIEGSTGQSLDAIQDEIKFFMEDKDELQEEQNKDTSNPFVALVGGYNKKSGKEESKKEGPEKKETWWPEKESYAEANVLRPLAEEKAKELDFRIFDVYKKAHGMPSYT